MKKYYSTILTLILAYMSWTCHSSIEKTMVARVNNRPITVEDFRSRLREYQISTNDLSPPSLTLKARVLNELIEEQVLLIEAQKRQIEVDPQEIKQALFMIQQDYPGDSFQEVLAERQMSYSQLRNRRRVTLLLEKVVADITKDVALPSAEEIEKYYEEHKNDLKQEAQVHLQQIVVKTEEDAKRIRTQLKKGSDFDELARTYSFTPEAAQSGDLGFITQGTMPLELEAVFWNLPIKQLSPVAQSEYGFHVFRVLERRPQKLQTLEEATSHISNILTQKNREERFLSWKTETLAKTKIERNDGLLATIP